jgi:hypothetical protein
LSKEIAAIKAQLLLLVSRPQPESYSDLSKEIMTIKAQLLAVVNRLDMLRIS